MKGSNTTSAVRGGDFLAGICIQQVIEISRQARRDVGDANADGR